MAMLLWASFEGNKTDLQSVLNLKELFTLTIFNAPLSGMICFDEFSILFQVVLPDRICMTSGIWSHFAIRVLIELKPFIQINSGDFHINFDSHTFTSSVSFGTISSLESSQCIR